MVSRMRLAVLGSFAWCFLVGGCGDDGGGGADEGGGRVRGRVTDVLGKPVADVAVVVGDQTVLTDAEGRFDTKVRADAGGEVQVAVEAKSYSSGAAPVKVTDGAESHVEVSVKKRDSVMATVAADGITAEGKDGFVAKVPADGLRTKSGEPVTGSVEVAYAVVKDPADVTAAPGRLESEDQKSLEGYGIAEVVFYQGDEQLVLGKSAHFEIPMSVEIATENGQKVPAYGMAGGDKRWRSGGEATVQDGKLVIDTDRASWIGAARELPVDSCVAGKLLTGSGAAAATTIRAARGRGLSLVQADTGSDGSFCLPVTPDDSWSVSTYYDDGKEGLGLRVEVVSEDAAGMCGDSTCKQVGDIVLPALAP
jgi:hypothetical protein